MICPAGHRVIASTGQHWTVRELGPGCYEYHVGECEELRPKLRVLDLFSGIGGISLGLESTGGFETVAFCEIDPFCREVLRKHWPGVQIHEDVRVLQGQEGQAEVLTGGFPCQDISFAGYGAGLTGERSGLWREFARLVSEIRPRYVIVENVAALLVRGMGTVLGDLARIGYDAEWSVVSACSAGAPHVRRRVFIVAYPNGFDGRPRLRNPDARQNGAVQAFDSFEDSRAGWRARLANPSALYGGADGLPRGMDRARAIGNSVVPQVVAAIGRAILAVEQSHPQPIPAASAGEGLPSDSTRSDDRGRAGSRAAGSARYGSRAVDEPQRPAERVLASREAIHDEQ